MRTNPIRLIFSSSLRPLLSLAVWGLVGAIFCTDQAPAQNQLSQQRLQQMLKRFPAADSNQDGVLSADEANAYRKQLQSDRKARPLGRKQGAPREFAVDPGWDRDSFPKHAVCYMNPNEIKALFAKVSGNNSPPVVSFKKPTDGALRIVGTGHSFMAPGYRTLPTICAAAGFDQPLYTHTGGGITGSTRYKWEQENGIFQFDGRPFPKLLSSISNARWDAMTWGPYFQDRPEYYSCWVDFCLKYNPKMKFYLSDAWPQLYQLGTNPKSESELTSDLIERMGRERREEYAKRVRLLREKYPDKIFVMPTSDAMVLAAKAFLRGELPGIEGIHRVIGGKERSLWRDQLGHLGPGFEWLEGYVFYATLYRKSPELLPATTVSNAKDAFPSQALDDAFRRIAWQAALDHPLSGVVDRDGDRMGD